jgi:uncharacterized protein (DUF362 family)/Pyruvate/2-oxoacid:ferredoxin oxidoreductase delta subunit
VMDMKSLVSIRECETYDSVALGPAIESVVEDIGGWQSCIKRGDRVLLKPNLLMSARPDRAVVTHPAFVEAVAAMVTDFGAIPFLGDSPPMGKLGRVLSKSGYDAFMQRLNVKAIPFTETVPVEYSEDRMFRRINLAKEVFELDAVINLPKLKTHTQMVMTLAVKNLFGLIVGADKAGWHMAAGKDFDTFATVLVQILEKVRPAVSIVDGILGMEGNGPSNGAPRAVGLVGASTDPVALDAELCRLVGIPVDLVRTCVIGERLGIGNALAERIERVGDTPKRFPLKDFKPPKSMTMTWNLGASNPIRKFFENHLITRPDIDTSACQACGVCMSHCPPRAIRQKGETMIIDRGKCISCFCCQELCPHDAISIVHPFLGRCLGAISR